MAAQMPPISKHREHFIILLLAFLTGNPQGAQRHAILPGNRNLEDHFSPTANVFPPLATWSTARNFTRAPAFSATSLDRVELECYSDTTIAVLTYVKFMPRGHDSCNCSPLRPAVLARSENLTMAFRSLI
jgi:hypothetical protein